MALGISDIPTILIISGIIFIFLGIVRKLGIKNIEINIGMKEAVGLVIIGVGMLSIGLITSFSMVNNNISIQIFNPYDNANVPRIIKVEGTILGELPDNQFIWIISHRVGSASWIPQVGTVIPYNGKWNAQAWIGADEDVGGEFEILVVTVDKESNQRYLRYNEDNKIEGKYPTIALPENARIYDKITVKRITPTPIRTPIYTQTPTSTPIITIKLPESATVSLRNIVEGTSTGIYGSNLSIYVLVYPIEVGQWWVQQNVNILSNGNWDTIAYFGDPSNPNADLEKNFRIRAIVTNQTLEEGQQWQKLPDSIVMSEEITVKRR